MESTVNVYFCDSGRLYSVDVEAAVQVRLHLFQVRFTTADRHKILFSTTPFLFIVHTLSVSFHLTASPAGPCQPLLMEEVDLKLLSL